MSPPVRGEADDTTIRTHVDAAVDRASTALRSDLRLVQQSVDSLKNEMQISLRALRERMDSNTKTSSDRFERHTEDDVRRFGEQATTLKDHNAAAEKSAAEMKEDLKGVSEKMDAMLLREASSMGKIGGIVAATSVLGSAAVAFVAWLLEHGLSLLGR